MAELPTTYVLDSFALLAYFEDEPGADVVEQLLRGVRDRRVQLALSLANQGEVYYITLCERGQDKAVETLALLDRLPIQQAPVDRALVLSAASIKASHAISYADAFAAGLAQRLQAPVVTGDPEFQKVTALIEVVWLPLPWPSQPPPGTPCDGFTCPSVYYVPPEPSSGAVSMPENAPAKRLTPLPLS